MSYCSPLGQRGDRVLLPLSVLPDDLVVFVRVESPNVIMLSPSESISGHVFVSLDSITCDQLLSPPLWLHSQAVFVLLSCPLCCVSTVTGTLQSEPFRTVWLTGGAHKFRHV